MGDKKMYKQFMIIIICKIIMIIQVNAGGKMKVKTNADKKNRNMNAEEDYGKYLRKATRMIRRVFTQIYF